MSDFERFFAECCAFAFRAAFGGIYFLHIFNNSLMDKLANVTKSIECTVRILTLGAFCGMMRADKKVMKKMSDFERFETEYLQWKMKALLNCISRGIR